MLLLRCVSLVLLLLFCFQESETFSSETLRWIHGRRSTSYQHIFASLSTKASDYISNPTDESPKKEIVIIKQKGPPPVKKQSKQRKVSHHESDRVQFRQYLRELNRFVRNRKTLANRLDDELKQMEFEFHRPPGGDERLKCRYPNSVSYKGPIVAPDVHCYAMAASAYARAKLGTIGGELAESVHERCVTYNAESSNKILKTAVANAWIQADDWEKADQWMEEMEYQYQKSGLESDAPDTISYTHYLEGLAVSKTLSVEEIVRRCEDTLRKMTEGFDSGENPFASPNRFTYIAAMKCRARRSDAGIAVVQEMEELLRELERRYEANQDPDLKPNSFCYVPVANAAARCKGGMKAARMAEALLLEQEHKYKETGDADYLPLDGSFTACFTAYARVESEDAAEASLKVRRLFSQMQGSTERTHKPTAHAYTAAINGIVIDATTENLEEASRVLRSMPYTDSVACQCGKHFVCVF